MERIIKTKKYGEVTVKNCMLENNDNTTLVDGIEIKVDGENLIEIPQHYYVDDLDEHSISILIEDNI
tara:strand:- start:730 stop:930 length:201 start_codon:yes stop_codon:yes gene_type:complete